MQPSRDGDRLQRAAGHRTLFWKELTTPSQFGGIIMLPILLSLFVPLLVTVAALSRRSRSSCSHDCGHGRSCFQRLMSMGAVCQSAFVATGWLATRLMRELSQVAATTMTKAPDEEVRELADQLTAAGYADDHGDDARRASGVLVGRAVFLWPASYPASQFGGEAAPGTVEQPNLEANYKEEPFVAFSAEAGEPARSVRAWPGGYGGWALIGLGVLILLSAATGNPRPRIGYKTSTPAAGAQLATTPRAIHDMFTGAPHQPRRCRSSTCPWCPV